MFTSAMKHLTAAVLKKDSDGLTRELLRLGLLDFVRFSEVYAGAEAVGTSALDSAYSSRLAESRVRLENLASGEGILEIHAAVPDPDAVSSLDLDSLEKELDQLASQLQSLRNRQREINQEVLKLEDLQTQLSHVRGTDSLPANAADPEAKGSFLSYKSGSVPADRLQKLKSSLDRRPSVLIDLPQQNGRVPLLVISLRRDSRETERLLEENGWTEGVLPDADDRSMKEADREIGVKISALRHQQRQLSDEYRETLQKRRNWFQEQWTALIVQERLGAIRSFFSPTDRTVLFSGWVPASDCGRLESSVRRITGRNCWLEWHDPDEVSTAAGGGLTAPVELRNPAFLKPFEMLVENYAVPEYGSVDPTPFVAAAFLSMFGLMFADAGQGLVLILIGCIMPRFLPNPSVAIRRLFRLIAYCGGAAVLSGVLFGSYFGRPWLPPLWFDYHAVIAGHESGSGSIRSVYDILLITIYFGISVLALGLFLNWINLLRKRDWFSLLFEKGGIVGGWIYGWGIYTAFYFAASGYRALPSAALLLTGFGVPGLLLFIKQPLHARIAASGGGHAGGALLSVGSVMNYTMEWIVELLEIFSGYLANTLSFMRVAGLGIAHVSLMLAFDQIAVMASPEGTLNIWSLSILILGNLLVIALEGLSAGIQSLRLNYYEFFSKYFSGSGRAYAPISLRSKL